MYLEKRPSLAPADREALRATLVEQAEKLLAQAEQDAQEPLSDIQRMAVVTTAIMRHEFACMVADVDSFMDTHQVDQSRLQVSANPESPLLPKYFRQMLEGEEAMDLPFAAHRLTLSILFGLEEGPIDELELVVAIDTLTALIEGLVKLESFPDSSYNDDLYSVLLAQHGGAERQIRATYERVYGLGLDDIVGAATRVLLGLPTEVYVPLVPLRDSEE